MGRRPFSGSFTQQLPIPEAGIEAAVAVMRSGRLHRYNTAPGEVSQTVAFEQEYAAWQGARYCLAVASCGQAMQIALRAAGDVDLCAEGVVNRNCQRCKKQRKTVCFGAVENTERGGAAGKTVGVDVIMMGHAAGNRDLGVQ